MFYFVLNSEEENIYEKKYNLTLCLNKIGSVWNLDLSANIGEQNILNIKYSSYNHTSV